MTDFRMGSRMCDYCHRDLPSGDLCGCDGEKEARFRWMDKLIANGVSADPPSKSSREDRLAAMLAVAIDDHDSSVGCSMREAHWTNQARALLAATPAPPVDETDRLLTALTDPNAVHVNMLRGGIAKPSIAQIIHIYGEEAIRAALADRTQEVQP